MNDEALLKAFSQWSHTESPHLECEFSEALKIGEFFWQAAMRYMAEQQEPVAIVKPMIGGMAVHIIADIAEGTLLYAAPVPDAGKELYAELPRLEWCASVVREIADLGRQHLGDLYPQAVTAVGALKRVIESCRSEQAPVPDRLREAQAHALALEQCSIFVEGDSLKKAMTDAAAFLRAALAAKGE